MLFFLVLFPFSTLPAQQDSIFRQPGSIPRFHPRSLIVPAVMITYGFVALKNGTLQSFDQHIRDAVWEDNPHHPVKLDNYLQYAPAAAVYILNAAGVKGRNNLRDRTILYVIANGIMGGSVISLKKVVHAERPDQSANDGFPSGHAATAFAAAEFLRQEYRDVSPWYGIGGYVAATATAYLRIYEDKHWFSELLPGAAIGFLSTRVAYWVYPPIQRWLFKPKPRKIDL
jgi:hypothetical protein